MIFFMKEDLFGHLGKISRDFKTLYQVIKGHPRYHGNIPRNHRAKKKYVCFLFHPVKSLGRVGRLSFFFLTFFVT